MDSSNDIGEWLAVALILFVIGLVWVLIAASK